MPIDSNFLPTPYRPRSTIPGPNERLLESVARALNAAGVPCLLWGHVLWHMNGVPTVAFWFDMVVPDAGLSTTIEVMRNGQFTEKFTPCPDTATCGAGDSPDRHHPSPAFHMHIEGRAMDDLYCLRIHVQSRTLWFLPPFDSSLANPRTGQLPRYLAFACDEDSLPAQYCAHNVDTVILIPKLHILTEALMRIMARDWDEEWGYNQAAHLDYIEEYAFKFGFIEDSMFPEPIAKIYKEHRNDPYPGDGRVMLKMRRMFGVPVHPKHY